MVTEVFAFTAGRRTDGHQALRRRSVHRSSTVCVHGDPETGLQGGPAPPNLVWREAARHRTDSLSVCVCVVLQMYEKDDSGGVQDDDLASILEVMLGVENVEVALLFLSLDNPDAETITYGKNPTSSMFATLIYSQYISGLS